ncbi:TPA: hypothetical protein HA239_00675 [Candidatus Woesearchaeota archaeon]|nr:hypothetical protein QT06_C0001G0175 [archaeon GW2011_AR15]MBS3104022.1 hypothetical protein [Candidatus Woesearchaeota archaeon]HIH40911.1 hypothetical protein [Candidatus Woesearchaeota archaeon]
MSDLVKNLKAIVNEDVHVSYSQLTINQQILTEGVVRKIYAVYNVINKIEGSMEAYFLPLRKEGENFTRDIFLPTQYDASHAHVQVEPEALQEFDNDNPYGLVVDGWMHFHPGYGSVHPSGTDDDNNRQVLKLVPHNKISGVQETLMKNLDYKIKGGKVIVSDLLTGMEYGIPTDQLTSLIKSFNAHHKKGKEASDEDIAGFMKGYFSEKGPGLKVMSSYLRAELQYAKSTIFNGLSLDHVLNLDGTEKGGRSRNVYSEAIVQNYLDGKPRGDMKLIENIPIKVIQVENDVAFTVKEIEELVREKIVKPRKSGFSYEVHEPVREEKEPKKDYDAPEKQEKVVVDRGDNYSGLARFLLWLARLAGVNIRETTEPEEKKPEAEKKDE